MNFTTVLFRAPWIWEQNSSGSKCENKQLEVAIHFRLLTINEPENSNSRHCWSIQTAIFWMAWWGPNFWRSKNSCSERQAKTRNTWAMVYRSGRTEFYLSFILCYLDVLCQRNISFTLFNNNPDSAVDVFLLTKSFYHAKMFGINSSPIFGLVQNSPSPPLICWFSVRKIELSYAKKNQIAKHFYLSKDLRKDVAIAVLLQTNRGLVYL